MTAPSNPQPKNIVKVSDSDLRDIFTTSGLEEQVQSGVLVTAGTKSHHFFRRKMGMPACTQSQMVWYKDRRGVVSVGVHLYLKPNGVLVASGKPDPKFLRVGNKIYKQIGRKK